jgi:alpha-tubulin suppressor-like RCC1 family protein
MIAVAAGLDHSLALGSNGTVWAWGFNFDAYLFPEQTTFNSTPKQIAEVSDVIAIAAGNRHSLALREDGTVWAWGDNFAAQLGDGTVDLVRSEPVQPVHGLSDVTLIAAGNYHSLALKADGTVWAWGHNDGGQLGRTTYTPCVQSTCSTLPVQVHGLSGVTALAGGDVSSYALRDDGTVWAWGSDYRGQLGSGEPLGSTRHHTEPRAVTGLNDVVEISAAADYAIALKSDGTVWAWGFNREGQLGGGTLLDGTSTPIQVPVLREVTMIDAGAQHGLARTGGVRPTHTGAASVPAPQVPGVPHP